MFTRGGPASTGTVVVGSAVVVGGATVVDGCVAVVEGTESVVVGGEEVVGGGAVVVEAAGEEHATTVRANTASKDLLTLRATVSLDVVHRYGAVRRDFPNPTMPNSRRLGDVF